MTYEFLSMMLGVRRARAFSTYSGSYPAAVK
jgi:hypothetical protein